MRSWLAIFVTLVACTDHEAETLTAIKARVCACTTASCAEQQMKHVASGAIQSTHRTQTIARGMLDCLAKLQAAEQPSLDPDAEDAAPESAAPEGADPGSAAAAGSAAAGG